MLGADTIREQRPGKLNPVPKPGWSQWECFTLSSTSSPLSPFLFWDVSLREVRGGGAGGEMLYP